jgi:hypothetical protein
VISAVAMANFLMEGHGIMTGTTTVVWRIEPVTAPRPKRHCSTCGESRLFRPSGKVRLNANGRRLDAWLIYKCDVCDRTWNLPLVERALVASITPGDLDAMHRSDPDWVRARVFDRAMLSRYCDKIDIGPDVAVTKHVQGTWPDTWSVIALEIGVPFASGHRLDRLLAHALGLARSDLKSMQRAGGLQIEGADERVLRKPVGGSVRLRFVAAHLTEPQRRAVSDGVWERQQDVPP